MTPQITIYERKLGKLTRERDRAREENESLKKALAESRAMARAAAKNASQGREQQAATAEVLGIVSRSPADAGPVFQGIVDSLARLFPGFNSRRPRGTRQARRSGGAALLHSR